MSAEDLNKTLAQLQAEIDEVDAEQRRRRDELEKGRKYYQSMLDVLGVTHEELQEIVSEGGFPPEAVDMYRKAMAGQEPGEKGEDAPRAEGAAPEKKRKKRMIVKL